MRRTNISHGNEGFFLTVDVVPGWAVAVERVYLSVLTFLDHPCCYYRSSKEDRRTVWGWMYDVLPLPERVKEWWQLAQFRMLNNSLALFSYNHIRASVRVPISVEQALVFDAQWVREQLEEEVVD